MNYPLTPRTDLDGSDALMEHFLDTVLEKGLELYESQEEAILEIFEDKNVILNTPTGSGKSLVAAAMHFRSASLGRKSVYTCPIKALVNEKFLSLCKDFGPENVGMMTGDASVNREAPILCCTAEILANIALRDGALADVDDVIMDEFHYYSDGERGVAWQVPLLTMPNCRFLLISATLGDTRFFEREVANLTDEECVTVSSDTRPVPLHFSYEETPMFEVLDSLKEQNKLPCYVVHFTQRSASETAQDLLSMNFCSKEEKAEIKKELQSFKFTSPFGKEIQKFLQNGVGLHHAGLLPKYRVLVEKLAQKGLLKIICGTDTLGVGVNVPIRTVLYTRLCKYGGKKTSILKSRDFHQISGRAGRKGFDDVGYVIALAPEHVIENKRLEAKAAGDPKKKKKLVKRKPPEKGFVHWDEETYVKLQNSSPEELVSRFSVNHGMLLNVLSREGDGCRAMRNLINDCHDVEGKKKAHRSQAFQLFRSLVDREIIEILPKGHESGRKLRVNVELQDDFSLNQTLALYLIDTVENLDSEAPDFSLKLMSLAEAILEDPDIILRKQLDKLKDEKMMEMKEAGVEFEERIAKLEELEYPKPEREFIYESFNEFASKHPWVGDNIRPKSIAREMYERYMSFSDYIKTYGLQRGEGLLLRHLMNTYRVLVHTIPDAWKTEAVEDMIHYLNELLRVTDSSLLDEWEKMKNPNYVPDRPDEDSFREEALASDIMRDEVEFMRLMRNEIFSLIRLLSNESYKELSESIDVSAAIEAAGIEEKWADIALEKLMDSYYETREWIRLDPAARNKQNTHIDKVEDLKTWRVAQILFDSAELNDWSMEFELDVEKSKEESKPVLKLLRISNV